MALVNILGAVNTALIANGSLPAATPLDLGGAAGASRSAPPRVWWIPTRDRFEGANPAVARPWPTAAPARALHTRWCGVEAHIWGGTSAAGDDFSATERLVNDVIGAIRSVPLYGIYQLVGGAWLNQDKSDVMALGHAYVLMIEFAVPITELQPSGSTTQVLLTDTITGQAQLANSTVSGNPPP